MSDDWEDIVAKIILSAGVLFLAFILTQGCTSKPSTPEPEVPPVSTPSGPYKAAWDKKRPEWTPILVSAIKEHGQALLQSYPEGVCGDRIVYWVAFFSKLAEYESNFNPRSTYEESWIGDDGKKQVSSGIFQLSVSDSKYNSECKFKNLEDTFDPKKNIVCAVFIMNKWIARDAVVYGEKDGKFLGSGRYWGVMRREPKRKAVMEYARSTCQ